MKKIISLLCFLFLINISCSNNDDSVNQEQNFSTEGTLLRKIVSLINGEQSTSVYYYIDGNKIHQINGGRGSKSVFTYAGNLIIEQRYFINDVLLQKEMYQYDSQERMIQRKIFNYENSKGYRSQYTYNSDGTVSVLGYKGDLNNQTNLDTNNIVYLFPNGDVQKIEFYVVQDGVNHIRTRIYTYDDKNYAMNGILNFHKIKNWEVGTYGNLHNNTSITYTTTENFSSYIDEITYTYNSQGYPISSSFFGGNVSSQQFYE